LTVTGAATLAGGYETGAGTTLPESGATLGTAGNSSFMFIDAGRTITLQGSSVATGLSNQFYLNYTAPGSRTLNIASGATLDDQITNSGLTRLPQLAAVFGDFERF
jgi:hypothetical protein